MNAQKMKLILLPILGIVTYVLLVLLIPFNRNGVFWVSFTFTLIAVCLGSISVFVIDAKDNDRIHTYSLIRNTVIYICIQTIISFIFIAVSSLMTVWLAILVYVIVAIGYCFLVIVTSFSKQHVNQVHMMNRAYTTNLRDICSRVDVIRSNITDKDVKNVLDGVYDVFKYSDPIGNTATFEIEEKIAAEIEKLELMCDEKRYVEAINLSNKLLRLVNQRNQICKNHK